MAEREGYTRAHPCALPLRGACGGTDRSGRSVEPGEGSHPSLSTIKKPPTRDGFMYGGEGGIRTLDTGLGYTPLAGERLQPLGHLSKKIVCLCTTSVSRRTSVAGLPTVFAVR